MRWYEWHADRIAQRIADRIWWIRLQIHLHWPLVLKRQLRAFEKNAYYDGFNDGWVTAMEAFADTDDHLDFLLNGPATNELFDNLENEDDLVYAS